MLKDIFDERADDLFESLLGDVYKVTHVLPIPNITNDVTNARKSNLNNQDDFDYLLSNRTTTKNLVDFGANISAEEIKTMKHQRMINELLERKDSPIPDFENSDDLKLISRRFENIRVESNITRRSNNVISRRTLEYRFLIVKRLMEQFIYATRYRMPYAQLLRAKYRSNVRYKIGYCFSLLRSLKQQQRTIFGSMLSNNRKLTSMYMHMKFYEKIVRLNVDIKDLIKFIKKLEYQRKMDEDPTYYDDLTDTPPNKTKGGIPHPDGQFPGGAPPGGVAPHGPGSAPPQGPEGSPPGGQPPGGGGSGPAPGRPEPGSEGQPSGPNQPPPGIRRRLWSPFNKPKL